VIAPLAQKMTRDALIEVATRLADERGARSAVPGADPRLLLKLIRIAGAIECERRRRPAPEAAGDRPTPQEIEGFADLFDRLRGRSLGGRLHLEHQPQPRGEHERVALADDGQGRRRGARVFEARAPGPLGRAGHGNRRARPAFKRRRAGTGPAGRVGRVGRAGTKYELGHQTYDFLRIKALPIRTPRQRSIRLWAMSRS
jgi:hypothetical protein